MTKIMLVEDDKSLREIYGVRLLAEGYDIVSAGDGEEALAMAIKERPALIITDIMMPKISGFDMLDILRSTTETRPIKCIVMTALGSEEQRARGEQLGADRYLVKSQVGIEDVVRTVHEVLGDQIAVPAAAAIPQAAPQQRSMQPPIAPVRAPVNIQPATPAAQTAQAAPQPVMQSPQMQPAAAPAPSHFTPSMPPQPQPPVGRNRVIQPLNNPATSKININELLDRELAKEAGIDLENRPPVASTADEKAAIQGQLQQFSAQPAQAPIAAASLPPARPLQAPTIQIDSQGNVQMPPTPPALSQAVQTPQTPFATGPPTPPPPVR